MRRIAVALLGGLAACAAPEPPEPVADDALPPAAVAPAFVRPASDVGRLSRVNGRLRFAACGVDGPGEVVDDTPDADGETLLRAFGGAPGGVTVMLRRDGSRIAEIRYGALEGPACDRLPPEGQVEARGNEPFWMVGVYGGMARLRTPDAAVGIEYAGAWSQPDDRQWVYEGERPTASVPEWLRLELTEARCADSMSGAWYPYRARLTIGDEKPVEGCALEGRQARPRD
jgi:uncharacterized membrane protein